MINERNTDADTAETIPTTSAEDDAATGTEDRELLTEGNARKVH